MKSEPAQILNKLSKLKSTVVDSMALNIKALPKALVWNLQCGLSVGTHNATDQFGFLFTIAVNLIPYQGLFFFTLTVEFVFNLLPQNMDHVFNVHEEKRIKQKHQVYLVQQKKCF